MIKGYYVICVQGYEIDGIVFETGQICWHPMGARPIQNNDWRRAKDSEIDEHIKENNEYDMRPKSKDIKDVKQYESHTLDLLSQEGGPEEIL